MNFSNYNSDKEVDFDAIENYLITYQQKHYSKINETNLDIELKENGRKARAEFTKFMDLIFEKLTEKYSLNRAYTSNWIDQGQNVPKYMWSEIKNNNHVFYNINGNGLQEKKKKSIPFSISFSVNINDSLNKVYYSMRVENRESSTEAEEQKVFNKHIYYKIDNPEIYFETTIDDDINNKKIDRDEMIRRYEKGEFKKIRTVLDIKGPYHSSNTALIVAKAVEAFKILYPEYMSIFNGNSGDDNTVKKEDEEALKMIEEYEKNIILYGPPGTGKTYNSKAYAVAICEGQPIDSYINRTIIEEKYNALVKDGRISFTTFHQSYGYEEFVEGIKAKTVGENVSYNVENGIFKAFCEEARKPIVNSNSEKGPYVFIIDEINRGNISKIFGELITLIEESKRDGAHDALSLTLPYSSELFSVPNNVYILGTMNTADRSIAILDTALRRRFQFIEKMPEYEPLKDITIQGLSVSKMLKIINDRIEVLYDREHTIGHAFFIKLKDTLEAKQIKVLASIFKNKIIPLLQEYFYEDYSKIQLVLGDNKKTDLKFKFILDTEIESSLFKGNSILEEDLPEKKYSINNEAFDLIDSYIEIYE